VPHIVPKTPLRLLRYWVLSQSLLPKVQRVWICRPGPPRCKINALSRNLGSALPWTSPFATLGQNADDKLPTPLFRRLIAKSANKYDLKDEAYSCKRESNAQV